MLKVLTKRSIVKQQFELYACENRTTKPKHSPLPVSLHSAEAIDPSFTMPREWILSSLCWVKTWSIFRWAWSSISTWINATKQAAKDKTIDENTRGLLIGRFFVSISTTQSGVLKPVKTCSQTVDLKLTLERSYGCWSLKGCFYRRVVPGALSLTLFPPFNTGCLPSGWGGLLCKHA